MLTLGIDVASQPKATAACWIRWAHGAATVGRLQAGMSDDDMRVSVSDERVDKVGLDVPLGWPRAFAEALGAHAAHRPWPPVADWRQLLVYRATDRWLSRRPLSVATDRIAYPATRVARVLDIPDRTGNGKVVEVYPAVALEAWRLPHRRYKGPTFREELTEGIGRLRSAASWLAATDEQWATLTTNDHLFDALVCGLVARAHSRGLCLPIPAEHLDDARQEGWIAVPRPDALASLP